MPDLERVLQGTPVTLAQQWSEAGDPVDPEAVTVQIDRADGTNLVAAGTPTDGTGTDPRTFDLSTTHTALLDRLAVLWTSPTKGTLPTYVEIAGGFLFSTAQAVAAGIAPDDVADLRTTAERTLERACRVAFVPRYERERLNGTGDRDLLLRWPLVRTVRAVEIDGTPLTAEQLATVVPSSAGCHYPGRWPSGTGNVVVDYEHGYDFPVGDAQRAALALATRGDIDPATPGGVIRAEAGEESFTYASPSSNGRFGIREVDLFVRAEQFPAIG